MAGDLPFDVLIQIAAMSFVTSWGPMEELHALQETCHFMRPLSRNSEVGRRIDLGRVSNSRRWSGTNDYHNLLHRLSNIGNPVAYFITRMHAIFPGLDLCSHHHGQSSTRISSALPRVATKRRPMWPPSSCKWPMAAPTSTLLLGNT